MLRQRCNELEKARQPVARCNPSSSSRCPPTTARMIRPYRCYRLPRASRAAKETCDALSACDSDGMRCAVGRCAGNGRAPTVIRAPSYVHHCSHRAASDCSERPCLCGAVALAPVDCCYPERSMSSASSGPDRPDSASFSQPDGIGLAAGDVTMLPCTLEPPSPSAANSATHADPSEAADLIGAPHSRPPVGPAPALAPPPPPPPPPPPLVGESRLVSGAALGVVAATRILSPQSLPAVGAS